MKPAIVSIAKKTAYLFAFVAAIAAIMAIISRFVFTPYLDARRPEIEAWASELLHVPVTIQSASASWFLFQPGAALHAVSLLDKESKKPVLQVRVVKVFFSIPKSIWNHKLVPGGVLLSGAELVVHQDQNGEFVLQGFPALEGYTNEPFKDESKIRDMAGLLFQGPFIILRHIDVRYTGSAGQKRFFTLYNLKLENSGDDHVILGKAILHQDISTELSIAAKWHGAEPDLQKISGKIYINLSGMSLGQWFQGLTFKGWEIKKGLVSAKIWADWNSGEFSRIQSTFEIFDTDLFSESDKSTRSISRLSGDVGWKKEGDQQVIAGDDLLIDWSSRLWPVTSFYFKFTRDDQQKMVPLLLNLGFVDIGDSRSLLASSPALLPDTVNKFLSESNLTGNLENIEVTFSGKTDDWMPVMAQGRFSRLSLNAIQRLPAIKNLSAGFEWKTSGGSLQLQGKGVELRYDAIFNQPLYLDQLTGDVMWQFDDKNQRQINLKSISMLNEDVAFNLDGSVLLGDASRPEVNLSGTFTLQNASHVSRYLPMKIFSPDLAKWLKQAFLSGDAQSGSLILRGVLSDFPFDHHNGTFLVNAAVNNVRLHYAPGWPDLKNVNGKIQFSGSQITIDVDQMRIMDIDVGQAHGEISNIGSDQSAMLNVKSSPIHTDSTLAIKFLHNSPLEKTIGKMFKNVELKGPVDVNLSLNLPLDSPDKTEVKGVIHINNAVMRLLPWQLDITNLTGNVNFSEHSTDAAAIQGILFGKPLRLDIATVVNPNGKSMVQATVNNTLDLKDLEEWLKVPFSKVAKGSATATTKINLIVDEPIEVNVESNLEGVALNLPAQYAKTANEARPFTAAIIIEERQPLKIRLNYASLLSAALIMDRSKESLDLYAVDLRLGQGDAQWPQNKGLTITGNLPELTEEKIKTYLDMSAESTGTTILPLRQIDVTIDSLKLYGISLTNCRLQLTPTGQSWAVNISSPEINGKITLPVNFNSASEIIANLNYINLNALAGGQPSSEKINPKTLPSIRFTADKVEYGRATLGNVSFTTTPGAGGMVISSFSIRSGNLNLQAAGNWLHSSGGDKTRLHGKAATSNVTGLLTSMGIDAHNFVAGNGDLSFDLNWNNAPFALSLSNMSGTANLNVGRGRIVEVSPSADAKMDIGRMLNLFSLQSIPRRLSFDFSDVFMKGYSFDSLRGDYKFSSGNVTTSNMRFDGPLAKVSISGRIGLVMKDFDLILSVTPYVTSSIPLAATLITGQPVIGVAAWAVSKVVSGPVNKVATYYYSVKGTWSNPVWNQVKGSR